jgi:hypothetical protein
MSVGTVCVALMIRNKHGPNACQKCHRLFQLVRSNYRIIYLYFLLSLTSSKYSCRCGRGLLHLVTINDTHSHTLALFRYDSSGRRVGPSHRILPHNTKHSRDKSMLPEEFEPAITAMSDCRPMR